jgi:competence protein ComEA
MRRANASDHEAAVARRLELLSAELAAVRGDLPAPPTRPRPVTEDDPAGSASVVGADPSWMPRDYTHIRAVPDLAPPSSGSADGVGEEPAWVPVPGRHAARRFGGALTEALPDSLRGRVALGPGQVAVVAVLVAVGLVVTCWWLLRGESRPVAAPTVVSTPASGLASPLAEEPGGDSGAPGAPTPSASARVVVDVAGKVRRPGIAVLDSGARVVDAIKAAGGARHGVDLSSLNLARVLTDGEQIVVGGPAPVGAATTSLPPGGSPTGSLVNLNTADETTLETLPEVGPVTAQSIITWRTQHHGFTAVDELLEVDGIGDATLAKLTPYVTI